MTKIEIKNLIGSVLFTHTSENNTTVETLHRANLEGVNLRGANFIGANLEGVNLRGVNLRGAYLRGANFIGANLRGANLRGADLRGAYLRGANLEGANLEGANLEGANLEGANLEGANLEGALVPIFCKWFTGIVGDKIKIGCKSKTVEEWEVFFNSEEEYSTKRGSSEFKQIQAVYEAHKAYLKHLNS